MCAASSASDKVEQVMKAATGDGPLDLGAQASLNAPYVNKAAIERMSQFGGDCNPNSYASQNCARAAQSYATSLGQSANINELAQACATYGRYNCGTRQPYYSPWSYFKYENYNYPYQNGWGIVIGQTNPYTNFNAFGRVAGGTTQIKTTDGLDVVTNGETALITGKPAVITSDEQRIFMF